ncbi:hypothetical protein FOA52_003864 [Chlamydomonas sp. UWO 241]|nr:hypothetical protein FOA52_003864 [Chlamydomonas sp. UWO 241]
MPQNLCPTVSSVWIHAATIADFKLWMEMKARDALNAISGSMPDSYVRRSNASCTAGGSGPGTPPTGMLPGHGAAPRAMGTLITRERKSDQGYTTSGPDQARTSTRPASSMGGGALNSPVRNGGRGPADTFSPTSAHSILRPEFSGGIEYADGSYIPASRSCHAAEGGPPSCTSDASRAVQRGVLSTTFKKWEHPAGSTAVNVPHTAKSPANTPTKVPPSQALSFTSMLPTTHSSAVGSLPKMAPAPEKHEWVAPPVAVHTAGGTGMLGMPSGSRGPTTAQNVLLKPERSAKSSDFLPANGLTMGARWAGNNAGPATSRSITTSGYSSHGTATASSGPGATSSTMGAGYSSAAASAGNFSFTSSGGGTGAGGAFAMGAGGGCAGAGLQWGSGFIAAGKTASGAPATAGGNGGGGPQRSVASITSGSGLNPAHRPSTGSTSSMSTSMPGTLTHASGGSFSGVHASAGSFSGAHASGGSFSSAHGTSPSNGGALASGAPPPPSRGGRDMLDSWRTTQVYDVTPQSIDSYNWSKGTGKDSLDFAGYKKPALTADPSPSPTKSSRPSGAGGSSATHSPSHLGSRPASMPNADLLLADPGPIVSRADRDAPFGSILGGGAGAGGFISDHESPRGSGPGSGAGGGGGGASRSGDSFIVARSKGSSQSLFNAPAGRAGTGAAGEIEAGLPGAAF